MRMRLLKESDPFDYWLLRQTSSRPQSVVLLLRRRTTGAKSVPKETGKISQEMTFLVCSLGYMH